MFRKVLRLFLATVVTGAPAGAGTLEDERKSEFFTFFHLQPSCEPSPADLGRSWHCFRPSGPKFEALVEVAVLAGESGRVVRSRLGLARTFINRRADGVFARDIAKSFLLWAFPKPIPAQAA